MDNITLMDIFNFIGKHIIEIVAFISIFVEIAPIKLHPITFILEILNKPIREDIAKMKENINESLEIIKHELKNDMDLLKERQDLEEEKISELVKVNEMNEISRIRWEIIEFSNSINNGQKHIRDEYRHIKDENRRYHELIKKYELTNGLIDEEMEKINKHYEENKNSSSVYF